MMQKMRKSQMSSLRNQSSVVNEDATDGADIGLHLAPPLAVLLGRPGQGKFHRSCISKEQEIIGRVQAEESGGRPDTAVGDPSLLPQPLHRNQE